MRCDRAYRRPSSRLDHIDVSARARSGGVTIRSRHRIVATVSRATAFPQNATWRPPAAMTAPASDGPRIRDRLNWAELSAIALPIAARSTRLGTIAWYAGV